MLYYTGKPLVILCIVVGSLSSCKQGAPSGVLSDRDMEEVLYDYHIAKGLANQKSSDSISYYTRYYHQKVFEKHGIDEACFDSSMIWYSRHTERLSKIYNRLSEQMGSSSEVNIKSDFLASGESTANGDTLNMWPLLNSIMVHSKGANYITFRTKTDTLVNPGDNLLWKFSTDWYYNEGSKQAIAVLTAKFKNDSVIYTTRQLYDASAITELRLHIDRDSVNEVGGFIYQPTSWSKRPRILSISKNQLLRIKSKHNTNTTTKSSNSILMQNH